MLRHWARTDVEKLAAYRMWKEGGWGSGCQANVFKIDWVMGSWVTGQGTVEICGIQMLGDK